jgi:hypothetical protein
MSNAEFYIDEQYLVNETVTTTHFRYNDQTVLTDQQLIETISGHATYCITHSQDHPEFDRLRTQLEKQGYISIQRNSWNGDTVLKSFSVNQCQFKVGECFLCAGALGIKIQVAERHARAVAQEQKLLIAQKPQQKNLIML